MEIGAACRAALICTQHPLTACCRPVRVHAHNESEVQVPVLAPPTPALSLQQPTSRRSTRSTPGAIDVEPALPAAGTTTYRNWSAGGGRPVLAAAALRVSQAWCTSCFGSLSLPIPLRCMPTFQHRFWNAPELLARAGTSGAPEVPVQFQFWDVTPAPVPPRGNPGVAPVCEGLVVNCL